MQLDLLTSSAEDTPASHSAPPGSAEAHRMIATSGRNICDLYKSCGHPGSLGRMLLVTSAWDSTKCWLTWRERVTPGKRLLFQLVPSMPRTAGIESGWLPTPQNATSQGASMEASKKEARRLHPQGRNALAAQIASMLPTPGAMGSNNCGRLDELGGSGNPYRQTELGKQYLNPRFVEQMMGFPTDWTACDVSETP